VPSQKIDVVGTVKATAFIGDGSSITGITGVISGLTPGYHTKASSATTIGNSLIYDNGTNVGIGSTVPQAKLDVEGSAYFGSGNVGIGSASPRAKLEVNNAVVFSSEYDNGNSGTSKMIDWTNGNKQKVTINGSCTFTFTAPGGPANLVLRAVHDNSATVYNETWPSSSPGKVKWPSGSAPPLTDTANAVDIVSCYYDGTDYNCQAGLAFQ
jgi:hypothetical protein